MRQGSHNFVYKNQNRATERFVIVYNSSSESSPVIDVHAHFGRHEAKDASRVDEWHSGDAATVSRRAEAASIRWSIVSALTALQPYRGNIAKGNAEAVAAAEAHDNLLFWVVVDPARTETLAGSEQLLDHPRCMGIKMHPFMHDYDTRAMAGPVFDMAARHEAVILAHSGDTGSYPEDFIPWADRFPEVRLIVAHLGHGDDGLRSRQVHAIESARHRNIWTDTSSAMSMISGLIEWAVSRAGDDRILFGTDTPLYFTACQKARVESAEISPESKSRILSHNALALFAHKLSKRPEQS